MAQTLSAELPHPWWPTTYSEWQYMMQGEATEPQRLTTSDIHTPSTPTLLQDGTAVVQANHGAGGKNRNQQLNDKARTGSWPGLGRGKKGGVSHLHGVSGHRSGHGVPWD